MIKSLYYGKFIVIGQWCQKARSLRWLQTKKNPWKEKNNSFSTHTSMESALKGCTKNVRNIVCVVIMVSFINYYLRFYWFIGPLCINNSIINWWSGAYLWIYWMISKYTFYRYIAHTHYAYLQIVSGWL